MKFALAELRKFNFPVHFEENIDLKNELVGIEDIKDIKNAFVAFDIYELSYDKYLIEFDLTTSLVVESSISLKELEYELKLNFKEKFSLEEDDESFLINGQTLDTKEAIVTNILINKPMSQASYDEEFISDDDEPEENVNNIFKSLKNDLL